MRAVVVTGLLISSLAGAAPSPADGVAFDLNHNLISTNKYVFAFTDRGAITNAHVDPGPTKFDSTKAVNPLVGFSGTTAAWIATDLLLLVECADKPPEALGDATTLCPKDKTKVIADPAGQKSMIVGTIRAACVLDNGKAGGFWSARACHFGVPVSASEQARAVKQGRTLAKITQNVGDAGDVVKRFEATVGTAKQFVDTISDRKDVVLFGSDRNERYVGGALVKKTLAAWKLAIKVRDGIAAGLSADKNVAWVAANVDATYGKTTSPYRMLVIYEKAGDTWKVVHASFSFPAG